MHSPLWRRCLLAALLLSPCQLPAAEPATKNPPAALAPADLAAAIADYKVKLAAYTHAREKYDAQATANGRYLIKFNVIEPFLDGTIEASRGYNISDPPQLGQRVVVVAALPIRRELIRPWFRVVARIGGIGGDENFLDPDPDPKSPPIEETIKATRDGQLFLFVNDTVLAIPRHYGYFYADNKGSAEVTITRKK